MNYLPFRPLGDVYRIADSSELALRGKSDFTRHHLAIGDANAKTEFSAQVVLRYELTSGQLGSSPGQIQLPIREFVSRTVLLFLLV